VALRAVELNFDEFNLGGLHEKHAIATGNRLNVTWRQWEKKCRDGILLEQPPLVHIFRNFPKLYGTRRFIAMFTRAFNWFLS
jgi:hypothetical protein